MLHKLAKTILPVAIMALGSGLSSCGNVDVQFGDSKGVPLADLDRSGIAPDSVVLASPDSVSIRDGDAFEVTVEGDPAAVDALRFSLDDGTLAIMREKGEWKDNGRATVNVTVPSLRALTLAGSGQVDAQTLSGDAEITVAGSGTVRVARVEAADMDVTLAGSGSAKAAGTARKMKMTVAGSGNADLGAVKTDDAEVTVAGSGNARFASDGKVDATIMGSGDVTVIGRATCKVSSMGSGTLRCENVQESAEAPEAPDAPAAPNA